MLPKEEMQTIHIIKLMHCFQISSWTIKLLSPLVTKTQMLWWTNSNHSYSSQINKVSETHICKAFSLDTHKELDSSSLALCSTYPLSSFTTVMIILRTLISLFTLSSQLLWELALLSHMLHHLERLKKLPLKSSKSSKKDQRLTVEILMASRYSQMEKLNSRKLSSNIHQEDIKEFWRN